MVAHFQQEYLATRSFRGSLFEAATYCRKVVCHLAGRTRGAGSALTSVALTRTMLEKETATTGLAECTSGSAMKISSGQAIAEVEPGLVGDGDVVCLRFHLEWRV